jgi:hypothetical protein
MHCRKYPPDNLEVSAETTKKLYFLEHDFKIQYNITVAMEAFLSLCTHRRIIFTFPSSSILDTRVFQHTACIILRHCDLIYSLALKSFRNIGLLTQTSGKLLILGIRN